MLLWKQKFILHSYYKRQCNDSVALGIEWTSVLYYLLIENFSI